jgi:diguanylate cyclase (GGDEF)-like protein
VPICLVSLVDQDRQWFKSKRGLTVTEMPRHQAFCAHAILQPDEVMEVPDATADARFENNPLVTGEPRIRFYAGAPLITDEGHALGTLCVIDRVPRRLDPQQSAALRALARQAVAQLKLRAAHSELRKAFDEAHRYQETLEEYQVKLERLNAQLQAQTVTDPLTGLYNRLAFTQYLNQAVAHAGRAGELLSLVFIDVDRFRSLNDSFGHLAGDDTLRRIAEIIRESARDADTAARYGGEEIAVILPATDTNGARVLAERFRRKVETATWPHRAITISAGIVTRLGGDERCDAFRLVADADAALYRAKAAGRNQIMVASDEV